MGDELCEVIAQRGQGAGGEVGALAQQGWASRKRPRFSGRCPVGTLRHLSREQRRLPHGHSP
ncbi:MAG: hypothetical protein ACRDSR_22685 [Pseudonocardiaceae bacterium]